MNREEYKNRPLYRAFQKYGIHNFEIKELSQCLDEKASEEERFWIKTLKTFENGYNATQGGDGQLRNDYETIYQFWANNHSCKQTQEHFHITSKSVQKALDLHNIPKEERYSHGMNIVKSIKKCGGRKSTAVVMCDLQTHLPIKEFATKADALRYLNKYPTDSSITKVCKGERQSAFGYFWKYKE